MKPALAPVLVVLLALAATTFAADESCVGRCGRFTPTKKCQCDSLCVYYGSCCVDYDTACQKKIARGDTFAEPEDLIEMALNTTAATTTTTTTKTTTPAPTNITTTPPLLATTQTPTTTTTPAPGPPADPDAVPCSGRPFDAFFQLKNGSIYAFRGEYFFELDERAVLPGYPKLIKDVWGISGPIDAAFTRINCQGKTYIFKGNKYWRFEDDVLDEDYPRDISVGFEKIPDDVDAAFAIPAPGHHAKERVYFFKGDQYYQYEFKHQPSHEECVRMSRSSPSVLFTRYTDLYCDNTWEDLFIKLFLGVQGHHKGPHFIHKDWVGLRGPVDAAMVGRLYILPKPTPPPIPGPPPAPGPPLAKRRSNWRRRNNNNNNRRRKGQRSRKTRSLVDLVYYDDMRGSLGSVFDYDYSYLDYSDYVSPVAAQEKSMPIQNVYFFKKDKYYRVDLQTKRIDFANPPYPRSIAKYWLGCKRESLALAEKR